MTTDRRRQQLVRRPDGSLWDEACFRDYLAALDRLAPKRAVVERLSRKEQAA